MPNQQDTIEIRSEEVREILTKMPHWMIQWGNLLLFFLVIALLGLTWLIKYPDIIEAETIITTTIPPHKVYARSTGKLDTILVQEGQMVQTNQLLGVIENTANWKDVLYLKKLLEKHPPKSANLFFPFDQLALIYLGEIEADFAQFETAYYNYYLYKKLKPYRNEQGALLSAQKELAARMDILLAQKALKESEINIQEKDLNRQRTLHKEGIISAIELENKEVAFLQAQQNLKSLNLSISQIKESIAMVNKDNRFTTINETKESTQFLNAVTRAYYQLKNSIQNWEINYLLQSEIPGKIALETPKNKYQIVKQEEVVFVVLPAKDSNLIARLKAPTLNSGKIKKGQAIQISLENYPELDFGIIESKVNHISLFPDEDGFYFIEGNLPTTLMTNYSIRIPFKQEMRGKAKIITKDLRLLERFFAKINEAVG